MEILLYKDLILNYIQRDDTKKEVSKWVKKIYENEHSVFLYSKPYIAHVQAAVQEDDEDMFQNWAKQLMDQPAPKYVDTVSKDFDESFLWLHKESKNAVVAAFAETEPCSNVLNAISNIIIWSKSEKPNYHWIMSQLAVQHPVAIKVNYFDFKNDAAVDAFFNDVFNIPRKIAEVSIFDNYYNLDHAKFNSIKRCFVKYYTGKREMPDKKTTIKKAFPKSRIFTVHPSKAHGRRIIFENIMLSTDNDFRELEVTKQNDWYILVEYGEIEVQKWLQRGTIYVEYR